MRQIATNAGYDGSVVVKKSKRHGGFGFDVLDGQYTDMVAGIIDPTKVTRSHCRMRLNRLHPTDYGAVVADIPEPEPMPPMNQGGMY